MKYIDADKLKELLKERQEEKDYREVIWLIDSLQQEQPVEGLEEIPKEIYILQSKLAPNSLGASWHDHALPSNTCNNIKYIRADLEKHPVEELGEEIKKYFDGWGEIGDGDSIITKDSDYVGLKDLPNIARHFAEWGAEHLKK
jgi:hypothetical protein